MRFSHAAVSVGLALVACGSEGSPPDDVDAADTTTTRAFTITSPDVTIDPGDEITYCYYFKTPNTEDVVIRKWASTMTPGSHHMIMYTTKTETQPAGTVSATGCGGFSAANVPSWTYATQTPTAELALPDDDGTGLPLGQLIPAGTFGYLEMHYLNATDAAIQAHVEVTAEALAAGAPYTQTAAFVTYNNDISIDPGATGDLESMSCATPVNAKFWTMSTHAHKQAVLTQVKDGASVVFSSDDWEHPGSKNWMETPFYSFASGRITYECTYDNVGDNKDRTVESGSSADTNEMCMATGYYFPATKPLLCINSLGPF
ncbi:MAG: hypothetical protein SFX73_26610 [Kofleriaceae bacterium]|nr:hypothetical protein [Kofleriaceae bacterium]